MPLTLVKSDWNAGNLRMLDKDNAVIATWDGTNRRLSFPSGSNLEVIGTFTLSGVGAITAAQNITASSATAFTVAKAGTDYALQVDTATASAVTGLKITSAASSGGLALALIGGAAAENLTIDAKGSGTITIGGVSTGAVSIPRALAISGALTGVTTLATSSTINSQTVSSAANFTGTMAVATSLNVGGGTLRATQLQVGSVSPAAAINTESVGFYRNAVNNLVISGAGTAAYGQVELVAARGTHAAPTTLVAADAIGYVSWDGYNDQYRSSLAYIGVFATTGWAATGADTPTYMAFFATPDASSTAVEHFRIGPSASITLVEAENIVLGTTTGTKFGTATTQKIGFYNATPIVQRSGAAQTAVVTTAATQTTPFGYSTGAQADAIVTLVNELRAWAVAQGFIAGA